MGTLPKSGRVEAIADAPIEKVYDLVADVTRTGEWSHECVSSEWLDGAHVAAPGARFRGSNKQGWSKWSRQCEVRVADAPNRFAFQTVETWRYRDSTIWTFTLEATDDGRTRIVQTFEVTKLGPIMDRLFYIVVPAHRDRTSALQKDVERLAAVAEGKQVSLS